MYIRESVKKHLSAVIPANPLFFAEIVGKVVFSKCIQNIDSMWSKTVDFDLGGVEGHKHFQTTFFYVLGHSTYFIIFVQKTYFLLFSQTGTQPHPRLLTYPRI